MCQGLAVRSLRSSSKVCSGWSTGATTRLVRETEKTPVTNTHLSLFYQAPFLRCLLPVCLWGSYSDNVTKLLILWPNVKLLQNKIHMKASEVYLAVWRPRSKTDCYWIIKELLWFRPSASLMEAISLGEVRLHFTVIFFRASLDNDCMLCIITALKLHSNKILLAK